MATADFSQQIATLHPDVRDVALAFLNAAAAAGLDPRFMEGHRSNERQAELYAQGRTAPGNIVTKAGPGQSNHNYGVAFDVVPGALVGQPNWAPESPLWGQLGELGGQHGLEWGGNWKFVDKPHFQLAGANWRDLQNDPKFAEYAPQAAGTPAPAMPPATEVADRPVGGVPETGNPAPAGAPGGLGSMLSKIAPAISGKGAPVPIAAPMETASFGSGDPMAATMAALQGSDAARSLQGSLMPDIDRLMGLGKRV